MVEIKQVRTKKEQKQFVKFPSKLYKGNENFVPFLIADELALFNKNNAYYDDSEAIYFLAYKNGEVVGRIAGIEQKGFNEKNNLKHCRFSRFDTINDEEVCKALLNAVENWAKERGLNTVHGPLGFNDLDREGLLVEGFDQLATFEENYNYPYYKDLLEKCGYAKDVDWLSFLMVPPKDEDERIKRLSEALLKRYKLHIATEPNIKKYIKKYKDGIFEVIDEAYSHLYGVVPLTEGVRKNIITQFKLLLTPKCMCTILDENEQVVGYGLGLPSLAKAVQKSNGKYLPFGLFRILKARSKFETFDFALVGVKDKYKGAGLTAIILQYIIEQSKKMKVKQIETNLNLENNAKIIATWKNFEHKQHKRYRSFVKNLDEK